MESTRLAERELADRRLVRPVGYLDLYLTGTGFRILPVLAIGSKRLKTNTVSNTAFRGFGGPQGAIAIENIVDSVARALGRDALDHPLDLAGGGVPVPGVGPEPGVLFVDVELEGVEAEVAAVLGPPWNCESSRYSRRCSYAPGSTEVVYIDGRAA